jgi:hypothetical protein
VKIDWCNTKVNGKELDPEMVHTEFSKALNATGRPIFLNLCRGYSYPPPSYTSAVANSWRINGDHHDNWDSTSGIIELLAPLAKYAGPGGWSVSIITHTHHTTPPHCNIIYYTERPGHCYVYTCVGMILISS